MIVKYQDPKFIDVKVGDYIYSISEPDYSGKVVDIGFDRFMVEHSPEDIVEYNPSTFSTSGHGSFVLLRKVAIDI